MTGPASSHVVRVLVERAPRRRITTIPIPATRTSAPAKMSNCAVEDEPWDATTALCEVGIGSGVKRPSNPATVRSGARIQRCWVTTTPGQRLWGGIDTHAEVPSDAVIDGHRAEGAQVLVVHIDLIHGQSGRGILERRGAEHRLGQPGLHEGGGLTAVERTPGLGTIAADAGVEDLEPGGELAQRGLAAGLAGRRAARGVRLGACRRHHPRRPEEAERTKDEAGETQTGR